MIEDRVTRRYIVRDFAEVINKNSIDAKMKMPDYVLAEMVVLFLEAVYQANKDTDTHKTS